MDINGATFLTLRLIEQVRKVHERMEAQQLVILTHIARKPGISQGELQDYTGLSLSAVGRNLDKLGDGSPRTKGLGLVVRYFDPVDRRINRVTLTKKGEQFWDKVRTTLDDAVERLG